MSTPILYGFLLPHINSEFVDVIPACSDTLKMFNSQPIHRSRPASQADSLRICRRERFGHHVLANESREMGPILRWLSIN